MQLIFAWVFLFQLEQYLENLARLRQLANPPGITEVVVATTFGFATIVLLMAVPLLSMRLFADEYRQQTLALLLTAPVSLTEIVLGKFVGLLAFLSIGVLLLLTMAASLALGGPLDWGLIAANVLGLLLLIAAFAAAALFISSLTQQGWWRPLVPSAPCSSCGCSTRRPPTPRRFRDISPSCAISTASTGASWTPATSPIFCSLPFFSCSSPSAASMPGVCRDEP
jgi:hypothetical protein